MQKSSENGRTVITINVAWISRKALVWIVGLAVLILVLAVGMWWQRVYQSPHRVFDGMLANNLSTSSVTRQVSSQQEGVTIDQYTQINFVSSPIAHNVVLLKQKDASGKDTEVKSESIGTKNTDFSRYISIKTNKQGDDGKPVNYSEIEGQWARSADDALQPPQYLQQAALGLMPFANVVGAKHQKLLDQIYQNKVYDVDYGKVKGETIAGRAVWTYPVKINVAAYVQVLNDVAKAIGLDSLASLDSAQYKSSPPIELNVSVQKTSRQLVQLAYKDGSQQEQYSGYGLHTSIATPTQTIDFADLQQRLQATR